MIVIYAPSLNTGCVETKRRAGAAAPLICGFHCVSSIKTHFGLPYSSLGIAGGPYSGAWSPCGGSGLNPALAACVFSSAYPFQRCPFNKGAERKIINISADLFYVDWIII